jgi:drug/metabolite transporter (DMT)-like permease
MFQWQITLLALLAVLLLLAGLVILILPDPYEGPEFHRFDAQHAVRALDALGGILLILGCGVAWSAGFLWQRRMYAGESE